MPEVSAHDGPRPTTSAAADDRAAKAKVAYELKKVQQRTAAIIVFSIAYHCVFALIALAKVVQNQGRDGDAYGLVIMSGFVAILMTSGIRGILGHPILSPLWTPVAIAPPIAAAIWLL